MDIILNIFYFLFDIKKLKEKVKKGKSIGWIDIIISPSIRYSIVIGLIIGLSYFIFRPFISNYSKRLQTKQKLIDIKAAILNYKSSYNTMPITIEQLIEKHPLRQNWTQDSWGNQIIYTNKNNSFAIISPGKDKTIGTSDDIEIDI